MVSVEIRVDFLLDCLVADNNQNNLAGCLNVFVFNRISAEKCLRCVRPALRAGVVPVGDRAGIDGTIISIIEYCALDISYF